MSEECPSCGGNSLTPSGDGGVLICDDCNEQFQGFRQEEMDDEDAAAFAAFARQSQEATQEVKRLNLIASGARAAIRAASAAENVLDYRSELFRGVALVLRELVDRLVEIKMVPPEILDPCWKVFEHWARMCHAGATFSRVHGATDVDFSVHTILALVLLAALYVRSSMLPRDLVALVAKGRISLSRIVTDVVRPEVLENERLRAAFSVRSTYTAQDVSGLAAAIATSDYAWPPIRHFFDGPNVVYRRKYYFAFPVGQEKNVTERLVALFGLPADFADRVERFRELRRIATAMSRQTTDLYEKRRRRRRRRVDLSTGKVPLSKPPDKAPASSVPEREEGNSNPEDDDSCGSGSQSDGDEAESTRLYSYELRPGLCELPFTLHHPSRRITMEEFPTTRTVLVDFFCTMRICFGDPGKGPDGETLDELQGDEKQRAALGAEWQKFLSATQEYVATGGGADADTVLWAGLSPPAVTTARGDTLRSYADSALLGTAGDVPLFVNDALNTFQEIAKTGTDQQKTEDVKQEPELGGGVRLELSSSEEESGGEGRGDNRIESVTRSESSDLYRIGNWVYDGVPGESFAADVLKLVRDCDSVDDLGEKPRSPLLRIRGRVSEFMVKFDRQSRGLFWWSHGAAGRSFWDEPAALGWVITIGQYFFDGTPAFVSGRATEDEMFSKTFVRSCDFALQVVLNYVDVYLGEEGTLKIPTNLHLSHAEKLRRSSLPPDPLVTTRYSSRRIDPTDPPTPRQPPTLRKNASARMRKRHERLCGQKAQKCGDKSNGTDETDDTSDTDDADDTNGRV